MVATREQRAGFGERLAELRRAAGLTQPQLGAALADQGGYQVSGPAVSDWERGVSAPDHQNALALERVLGEPEGALAGMLGYSGADPGVVARMDRLEAGLVEIRSLILLLNERLGIEPSAPQGADGSP